MLKTNWTATACWNPQKKPFLFRQSTKQVNIEPSLPPQAKTEVLAMSGCPGWCLWSNALDPIWRIRRNVEPISRAQARGPASVHLRSSLPASGHLPPTLRLPSATLRYPPPQLGRRSDVGGRPANNSGGPVRGLLTTVRGLLTTVGGLPTTVGGRSEAC